LGREFREIVCSPVKVGLDNGVNETVRQREAPATIDGGFLYVDVTMWMSPAGDHVDVTGRVTTPHACPT